MMTAVSNRTTPLPVVTNENPFDPAGSLLAITIYHERPVGRYSQKKSLKYYLKKARDREWEMCPSEDERLILELKRSVRFLENKVNGRYGDNKVTSVQVYFNDNKGGTLAETTPNLMLCRMDVLRNGNFDLQPNRLVVPDEHVAFLMDIMAGWQQSIMQSRK
jgi:hypothetical protein